LSRENPYYYRVLRNGLQNLARLTAVVGLLVAGTVHGQTNEGYSPAKEI